MRPQLTGFFGALAVIGSAAFLAISLYALVGLASRPDLERTLVVMAALIVAVALPRPRPREWYGGAALGIAVGLIGVIGLEFIAGNASIGAGQVGALLGAALVYPVLGWVWTHDVLPWLARAGLAVLLAFTAVALVRAILDGGGLGHDESAYALKARAWVTDTPHTGWQLHRAPLNSLLAVPIVLFTESEVALRLLAAAMAIVSLVAVGLVANRLADGWGALATVATVGSSLPFLRRGSEFLTDVPSAGVLLLIVWLVLTIVANPDRYGSRVYWLAPLIGAAFYMRYQSALAIAGISLAVILAWPRVVARLRWRLLVTGGLTLAILAPHLIWATIIADGPWGVVLQTGEAGGRQFLGEGLVDYTRLFPIDLAGPVGAAVMAIGIAWVLWKSAAHVLGRRDFESRVGLFTLITVVVAVVPLGLVSHGEPRFVFFPVWLLIAVGASFVVRLVLRLGHPYRAVALVVTSLLWLPLFTETVRRVDRNAEARAESFSIVVDASNRIEDDGSGTCAVLTTYQPQVTWYSTCSTELLRNRDGGLGLEDLDAEREYVLLFENGKRQPPDDILDDHIDRDAGIVVPARNDAIGDATIVDLNSN